MGVAGQGDQPGPRLFGAGIKPIARGWKSVPGVQVPWQPKLAERNQLLDIANILGRLLRIIIGDTGTNPFLLRCRKELPAPSVY